MGNYVSVKTKRAAQLINHPSLRAIPAPSLPLPHGSPGYRKYVEVADALLKAGKLTSYTKSICEQLGLLFGSMYEKIDKGLNVSAKVQERYDRLLKELNLVEETDAPSADQREGKANRYAQVGRILQS